MASSGAVTLPAWNNAGPELHALSSKAGELNALGTTSTIDLWRHFRPLAAHDEARNVRNAKWFTALWGVVAVAFALVAFTLPTSIEWTAGVEDFHLVKAVVEAHGGKVTVSSQVNQGSESTVRLPN